MSTNRINQQSQARASRYVMMQTPMGVFQFVVPVTTGPDPVAVAMALFQEAANDGDDDPLTTTLRRLKLMAEQGTEQPLLTGLMILHQMAGKGLVPPVHALLEGTGVTQGDLTQAIAALPAEPKAQSGLLDNMDNVNLN
jgi:hypothetical protein